MITSVTTIIIEMNKIITIISAFVFILTGNAYAFNLRKAGNMNISGSRIHSVFQDKKGLIWLSSNIGLSAYDGKETVPFHGIKRTAAVNQTTDGIYFVETLYGLTLFDNRTDSIKTFRMFNDVAFSATDSKGNIFVIQGNGSMYYKAVKAPGFESVIIRGLTASHINSFFIDSSDIIRIINTNGVMRSFRISAQPDFILLEEMQTVRVTLTNILFSFHMKNHVYTVNEKYQLRSVSLTTNQVSFIKDLTLFLSDKGVITSAVIFKNDFYFGTTTGLYAIRNNQIIEIPIHAGITFLLKDRHQDLIWICTANEGVYTYSLDPYTIKSTDFTTFAPSITNPVTSVYYDLQGMLWLGTEGDGIVCIPDYDPEKDISNTYLINSVQGGLPDNTVYALAKGTDGIWIGCQSGLAFYSYKTQAISKIKSHTFSLKNIRAIYEKDSILRIACYGEGIAECKIIYSDKGPAINDIKLFSVKNNDPASNRFSSIYSDNKVIWFVNNGNGLYKIEHGMLVSYRFSEPTFNAVNGIKAISNTDYIAVTDFGTIRFSSGKDNPVNATQLNPVAVKDILSGNWNNYWLSSDNGLISYKPRSNSFLFFDYSYGLTVTEYIPGASFKDEKKDLLFFGGINGFTSVSHPDYDEAMDYMPMLYADHVSLYGTIYAVEAFKKKGSNELVLQAEENFFSITFKAIDHLYGYNYTYYYKIGSGGQWINNGNSGTISFNELMPGQYDLYVKYYNSVLGKDSYTQHMHIHMLPPWYRSTYAYMAYFLLLLFIAYGLISYFLKRKKKQKEEAAFKAEQIHKEEIYEAKLDFFTHIAHEFCTPLTLIYGPCNLILQQKNLNPSVLKYADVIDRNARRMNSLINDLMEFKQIESGYKQPQISPVNISGIADRIIDSFTVNISGSVIHIKKIYNNDIHWNSDEDFLIIILTNLLSNAVKYSDDASADVFIAIENDLLIIKVSNKGKGIPNDKIDSIFNKFSVFNQSELQNGWQQNGLGLAITAGLIKLLQGQVDAESSPGNITTFTICLPDLPVDTPSETGQSFISEPIKTELLIPSKPYEYREERPTITIIDDDPEILWFICDVLNKEFNVIPINDPLTAMEVLSTNHTDLVLCDIMMQGIDGITLIRQLKSDEVMSHLPLIAISAAHEVEQQTEAINAGAEIYITKPFSTGYLISTIKRLLGRKADLKKYFESPMSAYELNMGKMEHKENRKFLKKIHTIISKNIQNKDLSPDLIATELGISTRSMYRKISEITHIGLQEMIREGKLVTAEHLLLKSKFTIDEIIFKSGFSNRSSFYRAFSQKHHCSPKEFVEKHNS